MNCHLGLIALTFGDNYILRSSLLCNFLQPTLTLSFLEQISQPHVEICKTIVVYILISRILNVTQKITYLECKMSCYMEFKFHLLCFLPTNRVILPTTKSNTPSHFKSGYLQIIANRIVAHAIWSEWLNGIWLKHGSPAKAGWPTITQRRNSIKMSSNSTSPQSVQYTHEANTAIPFSKFPHSRRASNLYYLVRLCFK